MPDSAAHSVNHAGPAGSSVFSVLEFVVDSADFEQPAMKLLAMAQEPTKSTTWTDSETLIANWGRLLCRNRLARVG